MSVCTQEGGFRRLRSPAAKSPPHNAFTLRDEPRFGSPRDAPRLPPAQSSLDIAAGLGLFHGLAFVVPLLPSAEAQEQLGPAPLEIHLKRDERQALFGRFGGKSLDFAAMEKQLPRTTGGMVELVCLGVFWDVTTNEPNLTPFKAPIGLVERDFSDPEAFYLASHKRQAALQGIQHQVVVLGLAVLAHEPLVVVLFVNRFLRRFGCRGRSPSL